MVNNVNHLKNNRGSSIILLRKTPFLKALKNSKKFGLKWRILPKVKLGSITSRCSGKQPRNERAAEIEPKVKLEREGTFEADVHNQVFILHKCDVSLPKGQN